jgi:MSHA pilin protein MshD
MHSNSSSQIFITSHRRTVGFTLIEIIIGMVVLAISLSIVTSLIIPSEEHSADQVHQIKAAELGQSMLDEILAKAFDENSDKAGGRLRCNEVGYTSCTTLLQNEEADIRANFDDVDDYNGYASLKTSTDTDLHSGYGSFQVSVIVAYNGTPFGVADSLVKQVTVTVTTPLGTPIEFTGYKANF